MSMREKIARAIATGLGDDYDHAFRDKSEWNHARGEKGGRFRDINEPYQTDYDDAADAVLDALMEPTEGMVGAFHRMCDDNGTCLLKPGFQAMIRAAKEGK